MGERLHATSETTAFRFSKGYLEREDSLNETCITLGEKETKEKALQYMLAATESDKDHHITWTHCLKPYYHCETCLIDIHVCVCHPCHNSIVFSEITPGMNLPPNI